MTNDQILIDRIVYELCFALIDMTETEEKIAKMLVKAGYAKWLDTEEDGIVLERV